MQSKSNSITILGSGLSGLMSSYLLALRGIPSLIVSKAQVEDTNSWMAQGGVAAAVSKTDSVEKHLKDTLIAGDGLCNSENVQSLLSKGPDLIQLLIQNGMKFDIKDGELSLAKEGGHKTRRILHVDDQTGRALHNFLLSKLQTEFKDLCQFATGIMITKLQKKEGEFLISGFTKTEKVEFTTTDLALATGGAGKAFLYTSNWNGATGDGLKLAHELGCSIVNSEMVQFHPTCLFHPKARNFLISEALRGEGAQLINSKKERFCFKFSKDGELAPRDIVSRAIEHEIKSSGEDCVFLDITRATRSHLQQRFPYIFKRCLQLGIDISTTPIPVVPAAHYFCGGVETVDGLTQTSIPNLHVIGEVAYTGLHGSNRLASNSLLECLVSAHFFAQALDQSEYSMPAVHRAKATKAKPHDEDLFNLNALWDETRNIMWNYVGINRSLHRLNQAETKLLVVQKQVQNLLEKKLQLQDLYELDNIVFFSLACTRAALARRESRGCHSLIDHPQKSSQIYNTVYNKEHVKLARLEN